MIVLLLLPFNFTNFVTNYTKLNKFTWLNKFYTCLKVNGMQLNSAQVSIMRQKLHKAFNQWWGVMAPFVLLNIGFVSINTGPPISLYKGHVKQGRKYNIWITHTATSPFWFWNVSRGEAGQFLIIKLMEHAFMVISAMLRGWSFTYRLFYRLQGLFGGKVPGLDKSYWGKTNVNMVKNKFFFFFFWVNLLYYSTITQKNNYKKPSGRYQIPQQLGCIRAKWAPRISHHLCYMGVLRVRNKNCGVMQNAIGGCSLNLKHGYYKS